MKEILVAKIQVYLDNAATTPIHPRVVEKMLPYINEYYGNPSSIHSFGRKVRVGIEEAREVIASAINAKPAEIYFVSGGTEANNFPLIGIAKTVFKEDGRNKIFTTKTDHSCVLETYEELKNHQFKTEFINVDENGLVDFDSLGDILDTSTSLLSAIHINNETGSENDLIQIGIKAREKKIYFHSDAVQSFGKIKLDVTKLPVDALSFSAHKIGGPKGIGAVYLKTGTPVSPIIFGGSQERNRRGGTENCPAIIGFAEAVKISIEQMDDNFQHVNSLRNYFIDGIKSLNSNIIINSTDNLFPYIISITFPPDYFKIDAEAMLMYLDINGIAASNGAACTSGTLKPSHVIINMGNSKEYASGTIRFSLGQQNTIEELNYCLEVLKNMSEKFIL